MQAITNYGNSLEYGHNYIFQVLFYYFFLKMITIKVTAKTFDSLV